MFGYLYNVTIAPVAHAFAILAFHSVVVGVVELVALAAVGAIAYTLAGSRKA